MRSSFCWWSAPPFLSFAVVACGGNGGDLPDTAEVGTVASALLESNALNLNALNPNALALNILDESALTPTVREAIQAPDEDGELSRQLMRYMVSCALNRTQSFRFSWTDATGLVHDEAYAGLLGLAPSWSYVPLSVSRQQWVSACVASRVNWYGVPVFVSARGLHGALKAPDESEREEYPMQEGAFWGNLFADPPSLHACHHAPNDANSRLHLRDCAAGHLNPLGGTDACGPIQLVGACDSLCDGWNPAGGYRSVCTDDSGRPSFRVITTFLPRG